MKAMVLNQTAPIESKPLKLTDVGMPKLGSNEVLMKVTACGVCRSNLHLIEGDWLKYGIPPKMPIIPGHEIVGLVEAVEAMLTRLLKARG